jgi:hypothetical protein
VRKIVKKKWVEALRSGEYAQTRGALFRAEPAGGHPAGYCCLGVLTDLYCKAKKFNKAQRDEILQDRPGALLPTEVASWAGFDIDIVDATDPRVELLHAEGGLLKVHLSLLNDGSAFIKDIRLTHLSRAVRPHTFAEIADLIEGTEEL